MECDILQLAARSLSTQERFNCYIAPSTGVIPHKITNITGLEYHAGTMYHQSSPVQCSKVQEAQESFNSWLSSLPHANGPLLVAHNVSFDSKVLMSTYSKHKLPMPKVIGFADSLKYFESVYPGKASYKQEYLVRDILGLSYDAHNAQADCESLATLLGYTDCDNLQVTPIDQVLFNIEAIKHLLQRCLIKR